MAGRHADYRRLKAHYSYSVGELAEVLRVHKNTVRAWHKGGLPAVDLDRPAVFRGLVVKTFLRSRREAAKRPCPAGTIYCLPCRGPKRPACAMVELLPFDSVTGNLRGICPDCERLIHRRVSLSNIGPVTVGLTLTASAGEDNAKEGSVSHRAQ